jgi:hypothetical protein
MADLASKRLNEFEKAHSGRRGPDPNFAFDHLILCLAEVAKAAGIPVTAHYSDAAGGRVGRFVDFVREAYRLLCVIRVFRTVEQLI